MLNVVIALAYFSIAKHLSRVILFNETVITIKSMMLWFEHWPGHQKAPRFDVWSTQLLLFPWARNFIFIITKLLNKNLSRHRLYMPHGCETAVCTCQFVAEAGDSILV